MSSRGRPVETASDYCFVVDHGEFVVQLVATGKTGGADSLVVAVVLKDLLRDAQDSSEPISQNPSQEGTGFCIETPRATKGY